MKKAILGFIILSIIGVTFIFGQGDVPTPAEYLFLKGVTSAIQTQIDAKAAASGGTLVSPVISSATASRAAVFDGSSVLTNSATTATELGYVSGVTSAIQTQLNTKLAATGGTATTLTITSSFIPVVTKTTNYTASATDNVILLNAGTLTNTLPTAVGITGRMYTIKSIHATPTDNTVKGDGAETIDGANTKTIASQYKFITVVSDGANWHIIAEN